MTPSWVNPSPPDDTLWPFDEGQTRTVSLNPDMSFTVDKIHAGEGRIEGTQTVGQLTIRGELRLGVSVVVLRDAVIGEPSVTFTLRRIAGGKAFIQVSAHPGWKLGTRQ